MDIDWKKLKDMKCPKCGCALLTYDTESKYRCCSCSFRIRSARFDEIINGLYKPKSQINNEEDNLSALNNL
jgi:hypothetical protein